MRRPAPAIRQGFTMVEILVVLAIIAIIAGVLMPGVLGRVRHSEASTLASSMDAARDAILEYRADVRRYPTHLRYLSEAPVSATDLCGRTVPAAFLSNWKGPYLDRSITTAGLKVSDAVILDAATLPTGQTASTTGELIIHAEEVDSAVARAIERDVDQTLDFAAGVVRWTNTAGGRGTLSYAIPVRGC